MLNGFLNLMEFFLRVQKITSYGIIKKRRAMLLEIGHFFPAQRGRKLLLLLQCLAFGHQTVVQRARLLIGHECIYSLTHQAHVRLLQNRLAKFLGLAQDSRFFNGRFHSHTLIQHTGGKKQSKAPNFQGQ